MAVRNKKRACVRVMCPARRQQSAAMFGLVAELSDVCWDGVSRDGLFRHGVTASYLYADMCNN